VNKQLATYIAYLKADVSVGLGEVESARMVNAIDAKQQRQRHPANFISMVNSSVGVGLLAIYF